MKVDERSGGVISALPFRKTRYVTCSAFCVLAARLSRLSPQRMDGRWTEMEGGRMSSCGFFCISWPRLAHSALFVDLDWSRRAAANLAEIGPSSKHRTSLLSPCATRKYQPGLQPHSMTVHGTQAVPSRNTIMWLTCIHTNIVELERGSAIAKPRVEVVAVSERRPKSPSCRSSYSLTP